MLPQIVNSYPPEQTLRPNHLYKSTFNLYPLAKHMFPIQADIPPTALVFIGLPSGVIPLPLCEDQAVAAFHAFQHPEALDIEAEKASILERNETLKRRFGGDRLAWSKAWHRLPGEEAYGLRKELLEFAKWDKWGIDQWMADMHKHKETLKRQWR